MGWPMRPDPHDLDVAFDLHDARIQSILIRERLVVICLSNVSVSPFDAPEQRTCSIEIVCAGSSGCSIQPALWGPSDYVYDARVKLASGAIVSELESEFLRGPVAAATLLLRLSSGAEVLVSTQTISVRQLADKVWKT